MSFYSPYPESPGTSSIAPHTKLQETGGRGADSGSATAWPNLAILEIHWLFLNLPYCSLFDSLQPCPVLVHKLEKWVAQVQGVIPVLVPGKKH